MRGWHLSGLDENVPCLRPLSIWVPVVLGVLAALVALISVVFLVNKDPLQEQHATITCARLVSRVTGLQTLGMSDSLSLSFGSPLFDILEVLLMLSFDIKLRLDCRYGHNVLQSYELRQLLLPCVSWWSP